MSRTYAATARMRVVAVALAVAIGACGQQAEDERRGEKVIMQAPPPGAIKVDEDLYMVEIGVDDRGCRMFSAWSNTRAVVAAVHYRDAEGKFMLSRAKAKCAE